MHRGYLIHWSLFLLKDSQQGLESFLNLVFEKDYYSLIETSFVNLFKFLIVIAIITKSKTCIKSLKTTLKSLPYEDEYTKLFNSIFVNFDVEASFQRVKDVSLLMKKDFFLSGYEESFVNKSKEILVENFLILNKSVDISVMAKYFDETPEETKNFLIKIFELNHPEATLQSEGNCLKFDIANSNTEAFVRKFIYLV